MTDLYTRWPSAAPGLDGAAGAPPPSPLIADTPLRSPTRPERPFFVSEFTRRFPRYQARHRVPAGLTGTAQVHGLRGNTSIADRARFDNYYIENWSFWEDIKILLRTVWHVVAAAGR